ncbi:hypothetical protein, partial [Brasilonema bromeliae]|uniref:hypothetical protein n=1 Tax=Brasilonema bromeliae TaxID=383615 RepID=UPI001B7D05F8
KICPTGTLRYQNSKFKIENSFFSFPGSFLVPWLCRGMHNCALLAASYQVAVTHHVALICHGSI